MDDLQKMFDEIPATETPNKDESPVRENRGKFEKVNEKDQKPKKINLESLTIDTKSFMVFGDQLDEEIKANLISIISGLNIKGYILRTRSNSKEPFIQLFEQAMLNKEFYLPWKKFNSNVESVVKTPGENELNMACWLETKLIKNKSVDDWNSYNPMRKLFLANELQMVLGKDLNSRVGFFIIDTPCGSVQFTKDTDYDNISFIARRGLLLAKFFGIKVYNVRNEDSMKELELLIN